MKTTFICEKCNCNLYEQITYTQAKCLQCGYLTKFDSGERIKPAFEYINTNPESDLIKNTNQPAPLIKRFLNYILDIIFIAFAMSMLLSFSNYEVESIEKKPENILIVFFLLTAAVYYILMEYKFGKTLGKIITKTKVVSTDGQPLSLSQCLKRTLCRIIPFERFSGLIFKGTFWHDTIPKTMVVEDN